MNQGSGTDIGTLEGKQEETVGISQAFVNTEMAAERGWDYAHKPTSNVDLMDAFRIHPVSLQLPASSRWPRGGRRFEEMPPIRKQRKKNEITPPTAC